MKDRNKEFDNRISRNSKDISNLEWHVDEHNRQIHEAVDFSSRNRQKIDSAKRERQGLARAVSVNDKRIEDQQRDYTSLKRQVQHQDSIIHTGIGCAISTPIIIAAISVAGISSYLLLNKAYHALFPGPEPQQIVRSYEPTPTPNLERTVQATATALAGGEYISPTPVPIYEEPTIESTVGDVATPLGVLFGGLLVSKLAIDGLNSYADKKNKRFKEETRTHKPIYK